MFDRLSDHGTVVLCATGHDLADVQKVYSAVVVVPQTTESSMLSSSTRIILALQALTKLEKKLKIKNKK